MNFKFDKMLISVLPFSERTRNALIKNNIITVEDVYTLSTHKFNSLVGVGKKGLKEIKNAISIIDRDKKAYGISLVKNKYAVKGPDFSDCLLFIPINRNKRDNQYSLHKKWLIPLDEYLYKIYENGTVFNVHEFLNIFVSGLSNDEILLLKYRFLFLGNEEKLTFDELSKKMGITGERVRQKESLMMSKLNEVVMGLKGTKIGKYRIENLIFEKGDVFVFDFSSITNNYINGRFLCYFNSLLLSDSFSSYILDSDTDFGFCTLMINNSVLNINNINIIRKKISKIYEKKRPENEIYTLGDFLPKNISGNVDISKYEYPVSLYLFYKYGVSKVGDGFLFKKNVKKLKYFIKKELNLLNTPIHYSEMLHLLRDKYPMYNWNKSKVMYGLSEYGKNVGNGLYIKQSSLMKGGTIRSLAENFLNKKGYPIKYSELLCYIKNHKVVKDESVFTMLFLPNEDVFIKYNDGNVGLLRWNLPKGERLEFRADLLLKFFIDHKGEKYTSEALFNTGEFGDNITHLRNSLHYLFKKGKIKGERTSKRIGSPILFYCD